MTDGWKEVGTKPLSPYFQALAREPRICPDCQEHKLKLNSLELTWDAAVWKCNGCGWFQTILAPDSAKLGPRKTDNPIRVDCGIVGGHDRKMQTPTMPPTIRQVNR